jgi:glyoxylase-like metal-dependent hydrolase (beta-lactamase superfamily II)
MGSLLRALAEAGVAREEIATVAVTHTHEDHVNGLVAADGSDAFPNLDRLFVPQGELPLFDGEARLARFRQRRLPLEDGFKLSAGVTAVQAHGHEIGHTAFEATSAGDTLLIWGDIVHVPSIQFARPELTWEFDADQVQARSTRQRILRRAAQPNSFVAGAHLDFPGIGTVADSRGAFTYTPL